MIKIPNNMLEEFKGRFNTHKVNIAACNIYYKTMILLNKKAKMIEKKNQLMITREIYESDFLNALSDIELVTPPTDAFIPGDGENELMTINQLAAEYIEITKRMPVSLIEETYGPTNALVILLKKDPKNVDKFHDDLFLYFMLYKYLDQIDIIRLNTFSNYTPIIEYIVNNITLDDWKSYVKTNKINEKKYAEKCEDILFNPDIASVSKYYKNSTDPDVPNLDIVNLIERLVSNTVLKNDIILILGVYLIISFAMSDFNNKKAEDSPCAKYVRDVLSKI
jgi:hypothetical protein